MIGDNKDLLLKIRCGNKMLLSYKDMTSDKDISSQICHAKRRKDSIKRTDVLCCQCLGMGGAKLGRIPAE